ncbi:MAG: hypothetical protein AAFX76_00540 [Planctomycetota bacterium]
MTRAFPRHPRWRWSRHLALPMLLCWAATPVAFNGAPGIGRSWWVAFGLLVVSLGLLAWYVWAAVLNYRHTLAVLGRGRCLDCGYELWGTVRAGRTECPECGRGIGSAMARRMLLRDEAEKVGRDEG